MDFHFTSHIIRADGIVWYHDGMTTGGTCENEGDFDKFSTKKVMKSKGKYLTMVVYAKRDSYMPCEAMALSPKLFLDDKIIVWPWARILSSKNNIPMGHTFVDHYILWINFEYDLFFCLPNG